MSLLDLGELFSELSPVEDLARDGFVARPIPGHPEHRIAKDANASPALLLSVDGEANRPPIILSNISVQERVRCRVVHPGGQEEEAPFTVVRCLSSDDSIRADFLRVAGLIVNSMSEGASTPFDVRGAVMRLIELFRQLANPPRKSVAGLWGELLLISHASDPYHLAAAWHVTPQDRFDFHAGSERLEVKVAIGRKRSHHFSLEQLLPVQNTEIEIASMMTERAAAGLSLLTLTDRVRALLAGDPLLQLHLEEVVGLSLGDRWREARDLAFDEQVARETLRFFDAASVPRPDGVLPPTITEVKFRSDLSDATPRQETPTPGGILRAARPSPRRRGRSSG